jgi:hypothetical protein
MSSPPAEDSQLTPAPADDLNETQFAPVEADAADEEQASPSADDVQPLENQAQEHSEENGELNNTQFAEPFEDEQENQDAETADDQISAAQRSQSVDNSSPHRDGSMSPTAVGTQESAAPSSTALPSGGDATPVLGVDDEVDMGELFGSDDENAAEVSVPQVDCNYNSLVA